MGAGAAADGVAELEELVVTGDTLVRFPAPERPRVFIRNDPPVPP